MQLTAPHQSVGLGRPLRSGWTIHETESLASLVLLLESGALMASLRRAALGNPVRHGGRVVSADDAWVLETLARRLGPLPLHRLERRHLRALPRLERAGFVHRDACMVHITPRGRALGAARDRERAASKTAAAAPLQGDLRNE